MPVCDSVALMHEGRIIESLTTEQFEIRYSEVVCRPEQAWQAPPDVQGLFGWIQTDREWSAVAESKILDEESYQRSRSGYAAHDLYKSRQREAVRQRVLGRLIRR